jgi:catechol 2,3-dioxygenase-like lactoylglutathione lyase family enzyme
VSAIARYLVDDLDEAVRFYADRLGFREVRSFGPVTIVERDGLELWLSGPGSSGRNQEGATPGGWNRVVLEVPELEAAVAGLPLAGERVDGPAGSWCVVRDPSGNPIELFEPR